MVIGPQQLRCSLSITLITFDGISLALTTKVNGYVALFYPRTQGALQSQELY